MSYFSDTLKILREKNNLSRREIAYKIGVTTSAYTNYEAGYREPNYELLVKISKALDVSTDELLGNTSTSPEEKKKKKVLSLFKQAGLPISESNELTISLTYGGFFTFELPKDEFFQKTFEILDEGEQLGENYVLEKIKFFFRSSKNLQNWFDDHK